MNRNMVLPDVFLAPIGLLALAALIPILIVYFIQPDPRRVELPTVELLFEDTQQDASRPLFDRLKRNLLLLLQILVVVLLAVSVAGPYISVAESQTVSETIVVIDGSASMQVDTDDGTRFAAAIAAARGTTSSTNSVIFAGPTPSVVLRSGGASEVQTTLAELRPTDAPGNLNAAISRATAIAGENARVAVFSDFAGDRWRQAVQSAQARGVQVSLQQFDGGGSNVGITARSFSRSNVTLTVQNFADSEVTRTITLGSTQTSMRFSPGGVQRVTLPVPAGGGRAQLTPRDDFSIDDVAYIAAPSDQRVDVLLLSNDPNNYLTTALSVIEEVSLTVAQPPTAVERNYDVILYSDLESERLLEGNVEAGRDVLADGGGVGVIAQQSPPAAYRDLLLIDPRGTGSNPTLDQSQQSELTRGIAFTPPETYLSGSLTGGQSLLKTTDGTPILATERRANGRVLYYGSVVDNDPFRFNYQYPVFWKRAIFYLAGREPLSAINQNTGAQLQFENVTTVETPDGDSIEGQVIPLKQTGFYSVGGSQRGASLYSATESAVTVESLDEQSSDVDAQTREQESQVPRPLGWMIILGGITVVIGEVVLLRRRGDL
ncbi:MAG: N-terminal double-transmembrane domain protein [Haloquadratum walsbyi J07HQW2]|uniref:N-terminal double-transmembrane domain protein n=2 Tax=Haloquadratum walsbyi TaxID=293091 RepID=U1PSM8_9EURY|nr:MAG: N-terminal double-transmembrane domain protein [Haloquadratum walsbyi J07HQW2]